MDSIPKGEAITDGACLIKGATDMIGVYLQIDDQKRHIANPETMGAFGLNWGQIKVIP